MSDISILKFPATGAIALREGLQVANKTSSATRGLAAGKLAMKTAAAPIAAGLTGVEALLLASDPSRRQASTQTAETRAKDPAIIRAAKGALDPINTIYGVASQGVRAVRSWNDAGAAEKAYQASKKVFDAKQAAR